MELSKHDERPQTSEAESDKSRSIVGDRVEDWFAFLRESLLEESMASWEQLPDDRAIENLQKPPTQKQEDTAKPNGKQVNKSPSSPKTGRLRQLAQDWSSVPRSREGLQTSNSQTGRLQGVLKQLEPNHYPTPSAQRHRPQTKPLANPSPPTTSKTPQSDNGAIVLYSVPEESHSIEDIRRQIGQIEAQLTQLQGQIYEPTESLDALLPLINDLLTVRVQETQEGIAKTLVPIIDRVIWEKSQQDIVALGGAMADVLPEAITQEVEKAPDRIASAIAPELASAIKKQISLDRDAMSEAIGPEMGRAIKAQIEVERDAMVDALYPVIGSTISKYMGEAIREINAKVENTFSIEGLGRKIRAKIQGVSEAELILQESIPFTVEAIFLVHKGSGLVIAEVQTPQEDKLESEMIAGMLTAIRSFANDCIVHPGQTSELHEIEYDNSKIVLEVAGYCYLAVVVKGEPSKSFIVHIRQTLSTIVQKYDREIEEFDGDPDTVPQSLQSLLEALFFQGSQVNPSKDRASHPPALFLMGGCMLLLAGIFGTLSLYHRQVEAKALLALSSTPQLAVYRLEAQVRWGKLQLAGQLPSELKRSLAERVTRRSLPNWEVDNAIVAVEMLPDPVAIEGEVQRLVGLFNQIEGVDISANYIDNQVRVQGWIQQMATAHRITQALDRIPGVGSIVNTLQAQDLIEATTTRIYFDWGVHLTEAEAKKLVPIRQFLENNPQIKLKIIGHSDLTGSLAVNRQLSQKRAEIVKASLVAQGIDPKRLLTQGWAKAPPDVRVQGFSFLSRCVRFEILRLSAD